MTFLMMFSIIVLSMLIILLSTVSAVRYLWQQLELAFELESDLRDTVDWSRKWLVDFNAGKTQLVSFGWSNNTSAIDVKMDGSLDFLSPLNRIVTLALSLLLKLPPRKLEPGFVL